jgi:hypothetical protein
MGETMLHTAIVICVVADCVDTSGAVLMVTFSRLLNSWSESECAEGGGLPKPGKYSRR